MPERQDAGTHGLLHRGNRLGSWWNDARTPSNRWANVPMKAHLLRALILSALVSGAHVDADVFTLSDLGTRCSEPDGSEEFAFCRGYIVASVEGIVVKRYPDCIPPMVNDYQFALLMRKYLNANSVNLHVPAVDGVLNAIAEIFKCRTKGVE